MNVFYPFVIRKQLIVETLLFEENHNHSVIQPYFGEMDGKYNPISRRGMLDITLFRGGEW